MDNYAFDANKHIDGIVAQIRAYFEAAGVRHAVLGISGGKDSTVVAALLCRALGAQFVTGIMMPNGTQKDINYSIMACDFVGIAKHTANINDAHRGIVAALGGDLEGQALINIAPRLRMTVLYAAAARQKALVIGTGNRSEIYIGYCTKFGDAASDYNPIGEYLSDEVVAIGHALGLPASLINKPPSDGLTGKTDEQSFGFSYCTLNHYIRTGECDDPEVKAKIERMHAAAAHKFRPTPMARRAD